MSATSSTSTSLAIRPAISADLEALDALERDSFAIDRLSRRRLRHWISAENGILLLALHVEQQGEQEFEQLCGYGLVLMHRGTRLARLYSLAVAREWRGKGVGDALIAAVEAAASNHSRLFMRLEVANGNEAAITLFGRNSYSPFGVYQDYYEDHQDALRMQKRIRHPDSNLQSALPPWYQQTTDFTCGPAALMMAMASLDKSTALNTGLELDLWREATTIFMTSGHGGCHPIGLALAAAKRGFKAEVWLNQSGPLFIEGVRSSHKKHVIALVDQQFRDQAKQQQLPVKLGDVNQQLIERWLKKGAAIIMLVSTYRMDGKRAPHWVCLSAIDEHCIYVHDPDLDADDDDKTAIDCQYMPIARSDFAKMSSFGRDRLRTAVVLRKS